MDQHKCAHGNCDHGDNNAGSMIALFVAGAALGAAAALLLAPKSGQEMRGELAGAADAARAELERKKEQLLKTGGEVKEVIQKNFQQ